MNYKEGIVHDNLVWVVQSLLLVDKPFIDDYVGCNKFSGLVNLGLKFYKLSENLRQT